MIKSRLKSRLCIDSFVHLGSKILSLLQIVGAHVSAVKEEMLSPQVMFAKDLNRWSTWPGGNMFLINFETAFELERCHIPGDSADHQEGQLSVKGQGHTLIFGNAHCSGSMETLCHQKDKKEEIQQGSGALGRLVGLSLQRVRLYLRKSPLLHLDHGVRKQRLHSWPDKSVCLTCCKASSSRAGATSRGLRRILRRNKVIHYLSQFSL